MSNTNKRTEMSIIIKNIKQITPSQKEIIAHKIQIRELNNQIYNLRIAILLLMIMILALWFGRYII